MEVDEMYCPIRLEVVESYFHSLNKANILFEDSETMFEACKEMVTSEFGTEDEDRRAYCENLINLAALVQAIQPWCSYAP